MRMPFDSANPKMFPLSGFQGSVSPDLENEILIAFAPAVSVGAGNWHFFREAGPNASR
jgi:hypothetical protein